MILLPSFLRNTCHYILSPQTKRKTFRLPFLDQTLKSISTFIQQSAYQHYTAASKGLLQATDSRIKLILLLFYIIVAGIIHNAWLQLALFAFLSGISVISRIRFGSLLQRSFIPAIFFGLLPMTPALFNWINPGVPVLEIIRLDKPVTFWIYHFPADISITAEGLNNVRNIFMKVLNSVLTTQIILHTTPFTRLIKAGKYIFIPDLILITLSLSFTFIFSFARTFSEMILSLKARWFTRSKNPAAHEILAGRMQTLFIKTWQRYEYTYWAMTARGFRGEIKPGYSPKMRMADYLVLLIALIPAGLIAWFNFN